MPQQAQQGLLVASWLVLLVAEVMARVETEAMAVEGAEGQANAAAVSREGAASATAMAAEPRGCEQVVAKAVQAASVVPVQAMPSRQCRCTQPHSLLPQVGLFRGRRGTAHTTADRRTH